MVTKSIWKGLPLLLGLMAWMSCQPVSLGSSTPMSASVLSEEYEKSSAAVRSKYDGKEIIVRGYAAITPTMPRAEDDQGSVLLEKKGSRLTRQIACWFSRDQVEQFSRIKGGQSITVKGIFNGEAGADLKFCKLVKIESESD